MMVKRAMKVMCVIWALFAISGMGMCEGEYYVMCQPDSYVNVRKVPKTNGERIGFLELGEKVGTDGQKKNGFVHVVEINTESGDGWVYGGFLVDDKPQIETVRAWIDCNGRVACRRSVGGEKRKWLKSGEEITLYASSSEWSITDQGFVQTEYILAER